MAEDVASRVPGAEALPPELRERVERAAARMGSIHERWSTSKVAEAIALRSAAEKADVAVEDGSPRSQDDALPSSQEAVSVTPILGIETDESDEAGRPRFKTLMGVPRSSPDIDELAGLDSNSAGQASVPIERSGLRPRFAGASPAQASPRVDEAPSLAGTSLPLPWEPGASSASSTRGGPSSWPSPAESALDVSTEVAALRTASRRRPWWIGLGTIAAVAALFALAAPRQRTLALRWLESEYHVRVHPTADAISDTARALRPGVSAATSIASAVQRATAQLEPAVAVAPRAIGGLGADPAGVRELAATAASPARELAQDSSTAAAATPANEDLPRDVRTAANAAREPKENAEVAAKPASSDIESSPTKSKRAARAARSGSSDARPESNEARTGSSDARSGGTTSRARAQVAAPRKPSQHSDNRPAASASKVAASATKARATRQNTPRKDGGSGIIRETPF